VDKLTIGLLAHVDAGKTTLSEALLYRGGQLRKLGRVDHQDAFLDTDAQERERGITIFSKQAVLPMEDVELTLLDTPGHVDFAAETERALGAVDAAVLVLSGPDGVQGHTRTLWKLLRRSGTPVFLFLNKMDQPGADPAGLMDTLRRELAETCLDFSGPRTPAFWEAAALEDEPALNEYLEQGRLAGNTLRRLIGERKIFPCFFGSALKLEGIDELLCGLRRYAPRPRRGGAFAARVFKVSRDPQGTRLTHLKLTGGSLRVKEPVNGEKVDQIRIYSGQKFTAAEQVEAGTVCAVTGLTATRPGQALGAERPWQAPVMEPALSYRLILPEGVEAHTALPRLRELCEEEPQLAITWNERLGELHVRLMGALQAQVLQRLIQDRLGWQVSFGPGSVLYRETIAAPVEGIGHFEPLRHYAEVHLLLEPLPQGSGLQYGSACAEDVLERGWQRLILTHLAERSHPGVLTGSPITDMRITLLSGKAHEKHTEGGDFRQATYRAVRQGLMSAQCVLLEPWYRFRLELPASQLGRALADVQRMGGETEDPMSAGAEAVLAGAAPVRALRDYGQEVAAYTKGRGRFTCESGGYRPCAGQEAVVSAVGYDPVRDRDNPCGSVFCSHGAGHEVPWDQVPAYAHLPVLDMAGPEEGREDGCAASPGSRRPTAGGLEQDRELMSIFERTYGAVKPRAFRRAPKPPPESGAKPAPAGPGPGPAGPEYLLVDGYNIIFAWDDLHAVAWENLDAARKTLMDLLSNYQGFRQNRVILVFDAYKVPQGTGAVVRYHNIHVVYTKEAETADSYIEKASYQLSKERYRVRVATSDAAEQFIILGHGALRMSAQELRGELDRTQGEIGAIIRKNNLRLPAQPVRRAFERARESAQSAGQAEKKRKGRGGE